MLIPYSPACMTCNPACSIDPHHPIPFCARGINHRHSMQRKFHGVSTLSPLLLTIQTGERRASANTAACLQKKQPKQGKTTLYGMCALVPWQRAAFFRTQIWIYLQFRSVAPAQIQAQMHFEWKTIATSYFQSETRTVFTTRSFCVP